MYEILMDINRGSRNIAGQYGIIGIPNPVEGMPELYLHDLFAGSGPVPVYFSGVV